MCLYVIIAVTFWYYPGMCFFLAGTIRPMYKSFILTSFVHAGVDELRQLLIC